MAPQLNKARSGRLQPDASKVRKSIRWSAEAVRAREEAREEERRRLARELHDDLGQALTGLTMDLSWLEHRVIELAADGASELRAKIEAMRHLVDHAMHTVREVITELRPQALDQLGLVAALEWQAETFARRAGLRSCFTSAVDAIELDMGRSSAVFRVFQEMLTNVARHADASRVDVLLRQDGDTLMLAVRDNGRGVAPENAAVPNGFGLLGMRERAMLLGGNIVISSSPRRGTKVTLTIPLTNRRAAPRVNDIGSRS